MSQPGFGWSPPVAPTEGQWSLAHHSAREERVGRMKENERIWSSGDLTSDL